MSRLSVFVRRTRRRLAERRRHPAQRPAIFDHVPKTGGTAINFALLRTFLPGSVAINQHDAVAVGDFSFAEQYPIITGHFTGNVRRRLQEERPRLTFTMIRDPIERAISSYSFWRHRIPNWHPSFEEAMVQAAKTLTFADFIRSNETSLKQNIFNTQYTHLAGGTFAETACEIERQAEHAGNVASLAAEFDLIGVTERLPESLRCFLAALGYRAKVDLRALLDRIGRNASPPLDPNAVSREDRAFIMERNRLDLALHAMAAERLDRALRDRRWAAFNFRRPGS